MRGKKREENILLRAPNWIGDAVMCLPAAEAVAGLWPGSPLTVLTRPHALPVFENVPGVTSLMAYENRGRHAGVRGRVALAMELKRRGFTRAVLFQNAFDAALVARMAAIPERTGYARDMRSPLLTRAVPVPGELKTRHQVHYYLHLAEALGAEVPKDPMPRLYVSGSESEKAGALLAGEGLGGKALAGAAPGASFGPAKRWPPERFAEVLERLYNERGLTPLVCGGPDDRAVCDEVAARLTVPHLNLAGRTSLREFISLLPRMSVFVTNDSGPMHLAAASAVPTVAVFGSTDPVATGPLGPATAVVKGEIECSPCIERECPPGHYRCLVEVGVDEVYSAATTLMDGRGAGAGGSS